MTKHIGQMNLCKDHFMYHPSRHVMLEHDGVLENVEPP